MTESPAELEKPEPAATGSENPTTRRRWVRWALGAVAVVLVLVLIAPYLFRIAAVRNLVMRSTMTDFKGKVNVGSAPLGWFSPVRLYDIEVLPPEGPPVMNVASFEGDVPLWRLLLGGGQLGEFTLDKPHLHVLVNESGANIQELFPPPDPDKEIEPPTPEQLSAIRVAVNVALFNGEVSWQGPKSTPWDVGGIQIQVGLQRRTDIPDAAPVLVVEPGTLLQRATVTPAMCDDVLKYAAPALSGATMARGEFSIELDRWRLPLDQPQAGEMGGRFNIHRIEVGPGPMLESILATVRLLMMKDPATADAAADVPLSFELARDSVVQFEMQDGRVYHEGFELGLGNFRLRTHGSVGLDQTIDIVAEIELPGDALTDRPFLQALASKTIVLPIGGTFEEPQIDAQALGRSSLDAVLGALDALAGEESTDEASVLEILEATGLLGGGLLGGRGDADVEGSPEDDPVLGEGQILDLWQQWRQQRTDSAVPDDDGGTNPSGRLLDRLRLRRREPYNIDDPSLEPIETPPEQVAPPSGDEDASIETGQENLDEEEPARRGVFRRRRVTEPQSGLRHPDAASRT